MLGLSVRAAAITWSAALAGCSALVDPDPGRLGDDPSGLDSGMTAGFDAGPSVDAGGASCVEGSQRCEGDTLLTCAGGSEVPQDCQSTDAFCRDGRCQPHVCEPSSRGCSADGGAVLMCTARGDELQFTRCVDGGECNPETLSCEGGDGCDRVRELRLDTPRRRDLCSEEDDHTHARTPMCDRGLRAAAGDQVYSFTLDRAMRVTIEMTDVDEDVPIDTIFYLRERCDDPSSQLLCADNVPCDASTAEPPACFGGVDVRQSRVTANLTAGTYYLIADAFESGLGDIGFGCGEIEISVRASSTITPGG